MNEIQYSIFEKEILKEEKIGLIILNCISVLCFAASISFLFIDNGIYTSVTFILLSILITLISILQYRRYQTKVIVEDNEIKVNFNGHSSRSFKYDEIKYAIKEVVIRMPSRGRKALISKCLIIYKDIEIYDMMEYRSYWKDKNILIIQDEQLIENLLKIIK